MMMMVMMNEHSVIALVISAVSLNCKSNVKVKLTLEQATKPQRGSRGIDLLFL